VIVELHARKIKSLFSTAIAYTMTPETALLKLSVRLSAREEKLTHDLGVAIV